MMDPAHIQQAAVLYSEMQQIDRALDVIDHSGTITGVTIASTALAPNPDIPGRVSVAIPTEGLQYPPQMIAAIRTQLEDRRDAINHELAGIGVGPVVTR